MLRRAALVCPAILLLSACQKPLNGGVINGPLASEDSLVSQGVPLKPLDDLGGNALRVQIWPSFSDFFYVIDYAPQPKGCLAPHGGTVDELAKVERLFCRDVIVTYLIAERGKSAAGTRRWQFHMPVEEWRFLTEKLDSSLDQWTGAPGWVADGTSTSLERVRDGTVRSVANNFANYSSLLNPAYLAQTETQRLLLLYGPSGMIPRASDWTVHQQPDPDWMCDNQQFAVPDPDGWGVGEGRCAKAFMEGK